MKDFDALLSKWNFSPQEMREKMNHRMMAIEGTTLTVNSIEDRIINYETRSTPIRIYKPNTNNHLPVILFIHGGAWVAGNLDTHDNLARYLSVKTEAIVISVGYLNSPEGKFPVPLEQCYDALIWITEHVKELNCDLSKLIVAGDSAGASMAASLCLMSRDRKGPRIDLQVLINPGPDQTFNGTLERQGEAMDEHRWAPVQYLADHRDANHPYVSPLFAKDLSGLPPAVILLAEKDFFRESGQSYGDRLLASNVPVFIYCQKGADHLAGDGARVSAKAIESIEEAVKAINTHFKKN